MNLETRGSVPRCTGGALGTYARRILHHFTLMNELWGTLARKQGSSNTEEQEYVFTYFVHYAEACFNSPPPNLVLAVNMGLRAGDPRFRAAVLNWGMDNLGEERAPDHPWRKPFAEALAKFAEVPEAAGIGDDDAPF